MVFESYISTCNTSINYATEDLEYRLTIETRCVWLEPMVQITWAEEPKLIMSISQHFIFVCIPMVNAVIFHHRQYSRYIYLKLFHEQHISFYQVTIYNTTCKTYTWATGTYGVQEMKPSDIWKFNSMNEDIYIHGEPSADSHVCVCHFQLRSIEYMPIVSQWDPLLHLRVHLWKDEPLPNPVCTRHYCYYIDLHPANHSWLSASAYCQKLNAELPSLNSFEEYAILMDIVRHLPMVDTINIIYIALTMSVSS